jgi:hypothetical protein
MMLGLGIVICHLQGRVGVASFGVVIILRCKNAEVSLITTIGGPAQLSEVGVSPGKKKLQERVGTRPDISRLTPCPFHD